MTENRRYAVPLPNTQKAGFSAVYRTKEVANGELTATLPGLDFGGTWGLLELSVKKWGEEPCLGTRAVDDQGVLGPYEWLTYAQAREEMNAAGSGLMAEQLCEEITFDIPEDAQYPATYRLLGINSKNRKEWTVMDFACGAFGITSVPLYDTLGDDAMEFILEQTKLQTVCADSGCVDHFLKLTHKLPSLKTIICFDKISDSQQTKAKSCGLRLLTYASLLEKGRANLLPPTDQGPDFVITICYTSGTTGNPKGVVMKNSQAKSVCAGGLVRPEVLKVAPGDYHISYLPMAHVYERVAQLYFIAQGAAIGYYSGDTLKLLDDVQQLRPTVFISVPRLYLRILDKVLHGVSEKSCIAQWLFNSGMRTKLHNMRTTGCVTHGFYDKLVFGKIQRLLGGRIRVLATGSAPLDKDVQDKISCMFSCLVTEGWGMTETGALSAVQDSTDWKKGNIGGICGGLEFKLASVPEMKYDAESDQDPKGELLVHGPSLFCGYFMNPEATASALSSDGWLSTGDVATVLPNGALKIIDRKKNIYKLSQGEYVAPEKIEGVYNQVHLIAQIFVYGKSEKSCLVAVVIPDDDAVEQWATKHNKPKKALSDHIKDPSLKTEIVERMEEIAKDKLKGFEKVKHIYLDSEPFSVENGLLTTTFKIVRFKAKEVYEQQLEKLYLDIDVHTAQKK